jgi:RNA polymerase sigma-70 factor (ECF subfamily)
MGEFEAFYRSNVRMVYALMLARTTNVAAAEDLTQETFLRAWRRFHELSGFESGAQRAWLARTARNLLVDEWRRESVRAREREESVAHPPEQATSDLRMDLAQALASLEDGDREMVIMRYLEEMNSREIGEGLGMPEGTVRRRLARCRSLLAEKLRQWAPGGGEQ